MFCNGQLRPYRKHVVWIEEGKCKPKYIKDLKRFCLVEWSKIPPNVFSLLNMIEIGSMLLSLPGEAAPRTKNRGGNNCEMYTEMYENVLILLDSIEHVGKLQFIWVMALFVLYRLFSSFSSMVPIILDLAVCVCSLLFCFLFSSNWMCFMAAINAIVPEDNYIFNVPGFSALIALH